MHSAQIYIVDIEDQNLAKYLQNLSATEAINYYLWKATKNTFKQTPDSTAIRMNNGCWADYEIDTEFYRHISEVFKPPAR